MGELMVQNAQNAHFVGKKGGCYFLMGELMVQNHICQNSDKSEPIS